MILDIMAGIKEPKFSVMCKIADGLGICAHELRTDDETYAVSVPKKDSCEADCGQRDQ